MYEDEINNLIQRCRKLKSFFRGVFAADNFPLQLKENHFIIVNASKENSVGTHWLLIFNHKGIYSATHLCVTKISTNLYVIHNMFL